MYYKDLTKYSYGQKEDSYNIGWLDGRHSYTRGNVSEQFLDKLWTYFSYPVNIYRGFHQCELCKKQNIEIPIIQYKSEKRKAGFYEIRVFDREGNTYAAPSLIFHYITCHHYMPPQKFIDAVVNGDATCKKYYEKILQFCDGNDFWLKGDRMAIKK